MKFSKILFLSFIILAASYYITNYYNFNPGVCPFNKESCYYTGGYYESRALFREKAGLLGAEMHKHFIQTEQDQDLTIDVAILNKPKGQDQQQQPALIHMSGTHGVEGYTGSAIQVAFLDKILNKEIKIPDNITIVLVHAVNPFGFLHNRRWNENGVDLNRNFLPEDSFPGELQDLVNSGTKGSYKDLETVFNLEQPWSSPLDDILFFIKAGYYILTQGFLSIKSAAVSGQYYNQDYIFFGGKEVQPSVKFLTDFIRREIPNPEKSIFIDVHTGLGPEGIDTLMGTTSGEKLYNQMVEIQQKKFDDKLEQDFFLDMTMKIKDTKENQQNKKKIQSGAGQGYELTKGTSKNMAIISKHKKCLTVVQEFGTIKPVLVLKALVEESSYWAHKSSASLKAKGSQNVKDAFLRNNIWYKTNTIKRGLRLIETTLDILNNSELDALYPVYD